MTSEVLEDGVAREVDTSASSGDSSRVGSQTQAEPSAEETNPPEQETAAQRVRRESEERAVREAQDAEVAQLAHEAQERQARESERRQARLSQLVDQAAVAAGEQDLAAARKLFGLARRDWVELSAGE